MPYPFDQPLPTFSYEILLIVTWAVHIVFACYVAAGTAFLLFCGKSQAPDRRTAASVLADWMPFAVSAAVTAGVAPLLFVQVLHQHAFYSANLLLSLRWLALFPVLIVGFYAAYVVKGRFELGDRPALTAVATLIALACFLFTGWSWTENHLLSLRAEVWPQHYAGDTVFYRSPDLLPRALFWLALSVPTMAVLLAAQLLGYAAREPASHDASQLRGVARAALGALGLLALAAVWLAGTGGWQMPAGGWIYLLAALAGTCIEVAAWLPAARGVELTPRHLWRAAAGMSLRVLALGFMREALRASSVELVPLQARHAEVFQAGGLGVFLVFAIVNIGLILWCFALVRNGEVAGPE